MTIQTKLAKELGALSEKILRKEHPYQQLQLSEIIVGYYYKKYIKFESNLDNDKKDLILNSIVDLVKWRLTTSITKSGRPAREAIPKQYEILEDFHKWVRSKEGNADHVISDFKKQTRLSFNRVVKSLFKEQMSDFVYESSHSDKTSLCFVKKLKNNDIYIFIEKGAAGKMVDFSFGFKTPYHIQSVATLFSGTQVEYDFFSDKDILDTLSEIIGATEYLLPELEVIANKLGT